MMRRILAVLSLLALTFPALAADNGIVVTPGAGLTIRSKDIGAGVQSPVQILGDTSGNPIGVTGGGYGGAFQPGGAFATLTATGSSASVALPAGTTVRFQNTSAITAVSCTMGVGSATATTNMNIVPPNSAVDLLVGSNTFGACIDQTGSSSSVVVLSGGSVLESSIVTNTAASIPAGTNLIGGTNPTPSGSSSLALTDVVCGSAASSCVLKASAGNLYGVYAECTAACWLMVFNATSAPTNGATTAGKASGNLVECISLTGSAGGGKSITFPTFPVAYSVGITVAISSTACSSLTLSTVGFIHGTVM